MTGLDAAVQAAVPLRAEIAFDGAEIVGRAGVMAMDDDGVDQASIG